MAWALERTNVLTNSGVPMGTPTHFRDDIKLGFCKILFIELTETLEQVVIVNVLDHKFASLSSEREVCLLKEQRHRPLQNQTRGSRLGSLYYDNKN